MMVKDLPHEQSLIYVVWLSFLLPSLLFLASLYWQYVLGEEPCPLCVLQRFLVLALALWWLVPVCSSKLRARTSIFAIATCLVLLALSANLWQVWLQSQPSSYPPGVCVPGVAEMLPQSSSWWGSLLSEGGDCHKVGAVFLGLETTHWLTLVLTFQLAMAVCGLRILLKNSTD
jgi:protein dithiol:quinone oxidoreductase